MIEILLRPKEEWEAIKTEANDKKTVILYPVFVAIIPALAILVGYSIVGIPMQYEYVRMPFGMAVFSSLMFVFLSFAAIAAVAIMINIFCNYFKIEGSWLTYFKLAAYSSTAPLLANVFYLIPVVQFLKIVGFYGCLTLFVGLPVMLDIPKEKEMQFVVTVIVFAIIISIVFFGITKYFIGPVYSEVL